jgi:hypothetical protein
MLVSSVSFVPNRFAGFMLRIVSCLVHFLWIINLINVEYKQ